MRWVPLYLVQGVDDGLRPLGVVIAMLAGEQGAVTPLSRGYRLLSCPGPSLLLSAVVTTLRSLFR